MALQSEPSGLDLLKVEFGAKFGRRVGLYLARERVTNQERQSRQMERSGFFHFPDLGQ